MVPTLVRDDSYPRARYLTQQFVDELCAADGMTDGLLSEVERVIFELHPVSERDGAVNFADLREMRGERHRQARKREEQGLAHLSERISSEIEKTKLVDGYANQIKDKLALIGQLTGDRSTLVAKGSEERAAKLDEVTKSAERVRGFVRAFKTRERQLLLLQDEVSNVRTHEAPEKLRDTQARHPNSGIKEANWPDFLLRFTGDVDSLLMTLLESAKNSGVTWKGTAPPPPVDPAVPLIAADAELERQPLALLEAEIERLQKLVSVDADTARRFKALSDKITRETELLNGLREKLADCKEAKGRLKLLLEEREATYVRVFQAVVAEQQVLSELYAPNSGSA